MSTLSVTTITGANTIKSGTASTPPTIQDSNGTQVGTFCRAWVNFNGTGTVAIRASFNVTSITDNGTGDYTVNFTNAMPDANYAFVAIPGQGATTTAGGISLNIVSLTTSNSQIRNYLGNVLTDYPNIQVAVFR